MTAQLEETIHFTQDELAALNRANIPRHVSIIMDGNRRWSRQRNPLNFTSGHWQGAETVDTIVEAAIEIGIEELTLYAFSTENWKRTPLEVSTLHAILEKYLKNKCDKMMENGVRFDVIGDPTPFPESVQKEILRVKRRTADNSKLKLTLALNYGGRDELRRVCNTLAQKVKCGELTEITEDEIEQHLDTAHLQPLDLFIRTSGEMRVSNFLLWQLSYAEIYVTKTLWPDFTPHHLLDAVLEYQKRERRAGT